MTPAAQPLWHVTLRAAGRSYPSDLGRPLRHLCDSDPVNMSARYDWDRLEIQFWDEGPDLASVAAMALDLWERTRGRGGLPDWDLVLLEVHERAAWRDSLMERPAPLPPGTVAHMK